MLAKADRSILKTADQTIREEGFDETIGLKITRKKKRVSFSESIAVKEIASRLEQQRIQQTTTSGCASANVATFTSEQEQQENILVTLPSLSGASPAPSKRMEMLQQWNVVGSGVRAPMNSSNVENIFKNDNCDSPLLSGLLQPKLTDNHHISFFIDCGDEEEDSFQIENRNLDEQAFRREEISMFDTSAAVAPNHTDDFSRFLSEEGYANYCAEAGHSRVPQMNMSMGSDFSRTSSNSRDMETSQSKSCMEDEVVVVEHVGEEKEGSFDGLYAEGSVLSAQLSAVSAKAAGPQTYTIIKDQSSIDGGRNASYMGGGTVDSWNLPADMSGSVLDFTQEHSRSLSVLMPSMQTEVAAAIPKATLKAVEPSGVVSGQFSSPVRRGRRRTFVTVHRSEDREQRHERWLRNRASYEPAPLFEGLTLSQQQQQKQQQQQVEEVHEDVEKAGEQSQVIPPEPAAPSTSTYKYTLPESTSRIDPYELVKFFYENNKLDLGSFSEALGKEDDRSRQQVQPAHVPIWEQVIQETAAVRKSVVESPQQALPKQISFSWTPGSDKDMSLTVSPATTDVTSIEVPIIDRLAQQLDSVSDAVSLNIERLRRLHTRDLASKTMSLEEAPALSASRLSNKAAWTYRLYPELPGGSVWQFSGLPGTMSAVVHVFSPDQGQGARPGCGGLMAQFLDGKGAIWVRLVKSAYAGPMLSHIGAIGLDMLTTRLGMELEKEGVSTVGKECDPDNTQRHVLVRPQEGLEWAELEARVVASVDRAMNAARKLAFDLIVSVVSCLVPDVRDCMRLEKNEDKLLLQLSVFPLLALVPKYMEFRLKATLGLSVDLRCYPDGPSVALEDAFFQGLDGSEVSEAAYAQLERVVDELFGADRQPSTIEHVATVLGRLNETPSGSK